jgi:hypothetical protein
MSSPSSKPKPRSKRKHVFSGVPIPENFKGNVYIGKWPHKKTKKKMHDE